MTKQKLHVSKGNSKLPGIPNLSKTPIKTCPKNTPCKKDCYALKAYRQYPGTRNAWNANTRLLATNPAEFERQLDCYLYKHKPEYFRIHVAGDFQSQNEVDMYCRIAGKHPATSFLAFTKADAFDYAGVPSNLSIILSAWPGRPLINPASLPVAWFQDGTESRIPADAVTCSGLCSECKLCWFLKSHGHDVVFLKH